MPSTNKTPHLGLNKWQGSDKPKMSDFNLDNEIIDAAVKQHVDNQTLHLTQTEKNYIQQPLVVGSYVGNAEKARDIILGFKPRFVLVFADTYPLSCWDMGKNENNGYCVMASSFCGSIGIDLTDSGFKVYHTNSAVSDYTASRMNQLNVTFSYIALR